MKHLSVIFFIHITLSMVLSAPDYVLVKDLIHKIVLEKAIFKGNWSYKVNERQNKYSLDILIEMKLETQNKKDYCRLSFRIGEANSLLSEEEYQESVKLFFQNKDIENFVNSYVEEMIKGLNKHPDFPDFMKNNGKKQLEELALEAYKESFFPKIGSKANHGIVYGPNGGGLMVVFTTKDKKYDISITSSNHTKEGVKIPTLPDPLKLALEISESYNALQKQTMVPMNTNEEINDGKNDYSEN